MSAAAATRCGTTVRTTVRTGQFYRNRVTGGVVRVASTSSRTIVVAPYGGGVVPVAVADFASRYERIGAARAEALASAGSR